MELDDLLKLIENAFPYIDKPKLENIPAHNDSCLDYEFVLKKLDKYSGPTLPAEAISYLCDEMNTLSAEATQWVLPSYLRIAISTSAPHDRVPEFLIYNLGPDGESEKETRQRLALLTTPQIDCLLSVLRYWQKHPHWGEYCPDDLCKAVAFLKSLNPIRVTDI